MTIRKFRRDLYKAGRDLGDIEAVVSGNPGKVAKRVVRKRVYRVEGTVTRRWLRKLGLGDT
jgi:hypothetical protein